MDIREPEINRESISLADISDFRSNKPKPQILIDKEESYMDSLMTDRPQFGTLEGA